jgi:hypothetical protein
MKNAALGLLLLFAACITHSVDAYPLYPNPETYRPADQVGIINGPIAMLDGQDVSDHGHAFALEPGCHSFKFLERTGAANGATGASYTMRLPQGTYSFWLRPGHYYELEPNIGTISGPTFQGSERIRDRHPDGTVTRAEKCPSL